MQHSVADFETLNYHSEMNFISSINIFAQYYKQWEYL